MKYDILKWSIHTLVSMEQRSNSCSIVAYRALFKKCHGRFTILATLAKEMSNIGIVIIVLILIDRCVKQKE